ncbi:hypothetical protein V8E52_007367 [Russula decolorans]
MRVASRPLIYITYLSNANIISGSCSFRLLEDGTTEKSLNTRKTSRSTFVLLSPRRLPQLTSSPCQPSSNHHRWHNCQHRPCCF